MKIEHLKFGLSFGMVVFLMSIGFWAVVTTIQNDGERAVERAALPTMELVGEFQIDNNSLYLYGFDFEGKRCLWAAKFKQAGLTCWDVK